MSRSNGKEQTSLERLADAIASEQAIAQEAANLRGDDALTREKVVALLPLLRRPIPDGFITSTPAVKGKPYASTGIKSVQVQIDRMDNVLTPLGWRHDTVYHEDGKLAQVVVSVLDADGAVLFTRESWGGVNQASTIGNLYKGSYTNAAKRALAMVGPGHEVYLGATDLDPDVSEDAAKAQDVPSGARSEAPKPLGDEARGKVLAAFERADIAGERFAMYLAAAGLERVEDMTAAHAFKLRALLDEEMERRGVQA